jgi:polysaccharide export outer membrane protein
VPTSRHRSPVPLHCALACAVLLWLTGCQTASIGQQSAERFNEKAVPAAPALAAPAPAADGVAANGISGTRDYRVGPLDLLTIDVFGLPDLKRDVRVSATGDFSLPLAGTIHAQGLTLVELQAGIAQRLGAKYLENPQVTVFVKEYVSQRVTIEGAVKMPGVMPLSGRTSLLQLVAMAGGPDREANLKGVVIYRSIGERRRAAVFDLRKVRNGELVDPEVLADDVVVVDYSGSRSALRDFLQSTPLLAVFVAAM